MPDRGLLEPATVEEVSLATESPFVLAEARWLQVTFEVERQAALSCMPCEVGRPVPPYARLLIASSPAGGVAVLSVGGRYRMMPRNVVVQALADGDLESARGEFGSGTIPGSVSIERASQEVTATIAGRDGLLATVRLSAMYAIDPSMLRWDGVVVTGRQVGRPVIAELTPAHAVITAFLSKDATVDVNPELPRDHLWRRLRGLGTISTCYAEGALQLSAPVIQQQWS